ncbi:MAG TPA: sugar phosphate isomerase/epimerase family protein [Bryobacteraceae bacterium]
MSLTNSAIDRRKFLLSSASVAAAATLGSAAPAASASPDKKMARLFPGCCAYSYRKYLQHGPMTMEDFIDNAVKLQVVGLDMTTYYYKSTEPAYLASLRHRAFKKGVVFSGVACPAGMVHADAAKRAQTVPEIKKWVDVTEALGASHLRVFAGRRANYPGRATPPPHGVTKEQAVGWVVEAMKEACDYSGKKGIIVAIEDHSDISQDADTCVEIMQRVRSPYAGINLDITHLRPRETIYEQIKTLLPYTTGTIHIRDVFDDNTTPVDMDRVWQIFADFGLKAFPSAEYQGKEDPKTGVPKLTEKIRKLCAKYSTA